MDIFHVDSDVLLSCHRIVSERIISVIQQQLEKKIYHTVNCEEIG
jgi:hypothetical protein